MALDKIDPNILTDHRHRDTSKKGTRTEGSGDFAMVEKQPQKEEELQPQPQQQQQQQLIPRTGVPEDPWTFLKDFVVKQEGFTGEVRDFIKKQDGFNGEVRDFMATTNRSLDALILTSPAALVERSLTSIQLEGDDATVLEAVRSGGASTFTYMLGPEGQKLAVSAAHCVDTHGIVTGESALAFMSTPKSLIGLVDGVGIPRRHRIGTKATNIPFRRDIAFLRLTSFPEDIDETALPVWNEAVIGAVGITKVMVGGKSLSRNVYGTNCVRNGDGSLTFLMESGEPGNSGTLMFRLDPDGTITPCGVFLGTRTPLKDVLRGVICPFPGFSDMAVHSLESTDLNKISVRWNEAIRARTTTMAKLDSSEQNGFRAIPLRRNSTHGILVNKAVPN